MHFSPERCAADSQNSGGGGAIAVGQTESFLYFEKFIRNGNGFGKILKGQSLCNAAGYVLSGNVIYAKALNDIVQLPNISGPVVLLKTGTGTECFYLLTAEIAATLLNKVSYKGRNVAFSFTEAGKMQFQNIDAEIEILTEGALPNHGPKISVGGCNDAYIHRNGLVATKAEELLLFQCGEKASLNFQRNISNFIQKQGTLVG